MHTRAGSLFSQVWTFTDDKDVDDLLSEGHMDHIIRRAVQSAGEDSFFLVVGYASKSGDLASNRQLSSDRATTIASVANLDTA